MPDNRNRKRPIQVKFFVDEKELAAIKQRMIESGTDNLSAYLRTMAMEGTAALSAQKRNGRTLSMAAQPFIPTIDGVRLFCYTDYDFE